MEDPEALRLFLDARGHAFREVMVLTMRNLAIAQHRDKACHRHARDDCGLELAKSFVQSRHYYSGKLPIKVLHNRMSFDPLTFGGYHLLSFLHTLRVCFMSRA